MDIYFLSAINFSIHFSFSLNPAIHRMGNAPNILCPRCKEQEDSHPHFVLHCKLSKTTLDFMSELINLNYYFNIPSKLVSKSHWELFSQLHGGVLLKILLPTLLGMFVRYLSHWCSQAFHDYGYDKINELFNFNCNLVSCFSKLTEILLLNWV